MHCVLSPARPLVHLVNAWADARVPFEVRILT
jgi:hypothetical protein